VPLCEARSGKCRLAAQPTNRGHSPLLYAEREGAVQYLYLQRQASYSFHQSVDIKNCVKSSADLDDLSRILQKLPLNGEHPLAQWNYTVDHPYQNDWRNGTTSAPMLPRGVYVVWVRSGAVERRVWFAVTQIATVVKRSRNRRLSGLWMLSPGSLRSRCPYAVSINSDMKLQGRQIPPACFLCPRINLREDCGFSAPA